MILTETSLYELFSGYERDFPIHKKETPNQNVLYWFAAQTEESLFINVITVDEIEKGIARIIDPIGKAKYEVYLENLLLRFYRRILPVSLKIGRRWGKLYGTLQHNGQSFAEFGFAFGGDRARTRFDDYYAQRR